MPWRSVVLIGLLLSCGTAAAQRPQIEIELAGVTMELLDNVRANLSLYQQRDHPLLSETLIRRLHRQADAEIRRALEPFGYYRVRVDGALLPTDAGWLATYTIDPGDPVRISTVDISLSGEGASDAELQLWRAGFPIRKGDPLLHERYESAKRDLLQRARNYGYIEGNLLRHRILIDLDKYQASIELHFETGPRYSFGDVSFIQQDFAEDFLRRYLTFRSGEPYSASKLLNLRRTLADSDYFDQADVIPLIDQAVDRRIPVRIELTARKTTRYSAGIGYSTDTGARGMLGYEKRRANRFGHRYGVTLRRSEILSSATARYLIPMKRPATDSLAYNIAWVDEDTDTVQRITSSVGFDLIRQAGRWLRSTGLNYERERYKLGNEDNSILLIPHVRWHRVSTEQRIQTRDGWLFSLEFRGAHDAALSNTSFFQTRSEGKYIRGLGERARLLTRASAGASITPEFTELPASQRFLAGGDQSIRGFAYNSLGPTAEDGTVIGGRHLLVGSIELERDVTGNVALAAFFDAGNAFNTDEYDVALGGGLGLRWRTPVGAIRVDIAQALSRSGNPWHLHLTVGPDL